jgi:lambda family phage portal protein
MINLTPSYKHKIRARKTLQKAFKNIASTVLTHDLASNRSGYGQYGASNHKIALRDWKALSGSADQDIVPNLPLMRQRSRDLFMGFCIAGGAILALRTNVIGEGLLALPRIDHEYLGISVDNAAEINKRIRNEWELYSTSVECDWDRRSTMGQLQDLAFTNQSVSGDVLTLLPMKQRRGSVYDTRIRLIEADRVMSPIYPAEKVIQEYTDQGRPKVYGGVELANDGEIAAYWVSKWHPGDTQYGARANTMLEDNFNRIPAFGDETNRPLAFLIGELERPEQRRGVPLFAKCLTEMKQMQRYIESTTVQNVIKSYFSSFVTSEMPSTEMFQGLVDEDEMKDAVFHNPYQVRLAPGVVNWMRPGDKITFPNNGSGPEAEFEHYVTSMVKFIGSTLGVPWEILLKVFLNNYSASRASLLEFWKRVRVLRQMMVNQFCQPVYNAWFMEAAAKKILNARGFFDDPRIFKAWTRCGWIGSNPGSIDPLKEIMASEVKIKIGVSNQEMECLEHGGNDWRDITAQQGIEKAFAKENDLPYPRSIDTKGWPLPDSAIEGEETKPDPQHPGFNRLAYAIGLRLLGDAP